MSAKDKQVGGGHYKDMPIQPIDFITKNNLPFIEGCIIKYISRWRSKGGVQDLRKVIHYAELLIEAEEEAAVYDRGNPHHYRLTPGLELPADLPDGTVVEGPASAMKWVRLGVMHRGVLVRDGA